jgi:dipeptidyl aminopeptidase/acylaminoacyl peptidase
VRHEGAGPIPIADLFFTRSASGASVSPDGATLVFTTNTTGRPNLWRMPLAGGYPVQLSPSEDRQSRASFSPDGKWIVYQQDEGGGEIYDLFVLPAGGGPPENITKTDSVSETGALWSPDGKSLTFASKAKTASGDDIALMDVASRSVRTLVHETAKDWSWSPVAWGPRGDVLYANRAQAGELEGDVYRIDVRTGEKTLLTPRASPCWIDASALSPDGKTLLITTNETTGFRNPALLDIATKERTLLAHSEWESFSGEFSPDGSSLTYVVNADGRADTFLMDLKTRKAERLPLPEGLTVPGGSFTSFTKTGGLVLTHQSSSRPADLWLYEPQTRAARPLTVSATASLESSLIPPATLVHYASGDGTLISAFLYVPLNIARDGSHPGIVLPHGGPTGQTLDTFNPTVAALSSRGYLVIAPNVRGSTGYGEAFQKANYQDLGGGDLQDEVAAARFLVETGYVNQKKIGITGGSYGGFMTLMAIGRTPGVFSAAVELYGIINWYTMLEHEDPRLQEYEKSLLGDPVKDKKVYDAASPVTYIRNATAPLLVLQGENDIRVPREEAAQVVEILKKEGRTVDAHYYPNEGHGFVKRENRIDAVKRTVEWFDRYLKTP